MRVGWDPCLSTFFAQVLDEHLQGDITPLVWIGTTPHEIPTPGPAVNAVRPYAEIPRNLEEVLTAEADSEGQRLDWHPSYLQVSWRASRPWYPSS